MVIMRNYRSPKNNCVAQILTPFSFGRWITVWLRLELRTSVGLVYFVTVCSSVGWFFDFSKNCQFQVFEKNSEIKNQPVLVIWKQQNQKNWRFQVFQNPRRTATFHGWAANSLLVLWHYFLPGQVLPELYFPSQCWGEYSKFWPCWLYAFICGMTSSRGLVQNQKTAQHLSGPGIWVSAKMKYQEETGTYQRTPANYAPVWIWL